MSNNFEMIGLFPVPLLKIKFKDHYKYNFPEVEKKDKKPDIWIKSLNTTYPYIPDDDLIVPPTVRDSLMRDMKDAIVDVFEPLNLPTNIGYNNFWYNIYHDNQGQEKHNHLGHIGQPTTFPFWSGVYYNKNSTPTTFYRDGGIYRTQLFDGVQNTALGECLTHIAAPSVEDGDILLFPPYLQHAVESKPHHKNKMRMTFSFNITLIS